jgi:cytochrome b subunit of formate dehydrogenase
VSFVLLAVTGFALKYPDSIASWVTFHNEELRRLVHRISAIVMLLVSFWHIVYLLTHKDGRRLLIELFPSWQDLKDVIHNLRYMIGLEKHHAHHANFGYAEKLEYWALVWGTIVMTVTGFIMWFKIAATHYLPHWAMDVAITIHFYEAILACLAIIVWHFYHIIYDPDTYPLNFAFWDGKVVHHEEDKKEPSKNKPTSKR